MIGPTLSLKAGGVLAINEEEAPAPQRKAPSYEVRGKGVKPQAQLLVSRKIQTAKES